MHTRLVSFIGATDLERGVPFVREKVVPLLEQQKGYRGLTASADPGNGVFAVLSLWDSEEERDATESALAATRQEAAGVIGGEVKVETFEQLVADVGEPRPGPGSSLMVTQINMAPEKIDDNLEFFKRDIVPQLKASRGFQAVRAMVNRTTGEGLVGTAWADAGAMEQASQDAVARREAAAERGVDFGETSFREIVYTDLR